MAGPGSGGTRLRPVRSPGVGTERARGDRDDRVRRPGVARPARCSRGRDCAGPGRLRRSSWRAGPDSAQRWSRTTSRDVPACSWPGCEPVRARRPRRRRWPPGASSPCRPTPSTASPSILGYRERSSRLFALKGRPEQLALPVLIADPAGLAGLAEVTPIAEQLASRYWPGPLTLVVARRREVSFDLGGDPAHDRAPLPGELNGARAPQKDRTARGDERQPPRGVAVAHRGRGPASASEPTSPRCSTAAAATAGRRRWSRSSGAISSACAKAPCHSPRSPPRAPRKAEPENGSVRGRRLRQVLPRAGQAVLPEPVRRLRLAWTQQHRADQQHHDADDGPLAVTAHPRPREGAGSLCDPDGSGQEEDRSDNSREPTWPSPIWSRSRNHLGPAR